MYLEKPKKKEQEMFPPQDAREYDAFSDGGRFVFTGKAVGSINWYNTEIVLSEVFHRRNQEEKSEVRLLSNDEIIEIAEKYS